MTIPFPPQKLPDADLWEYYRARGLSPEDATLHVERRRSTQPRKAPSTSPSRGASALAGAAQGATSGFADEIVGLMRALGPQNPRPMGSPAFWGGTVLGGAQEPPVTSSSINEHIGTVRDQMSAARWAHPGAAVVGNVAGSMLNPLARLLPAPINAARGTATGAALGAAQGLGEGERSLGERLLSAGLGGAVGAASGAVLGPTGGKAINKLIKRFTPAAQNAWNAVMRHFKGRGLPPAQAQAAAEIAAETAVRASLQKANQSPEIIERVIQAMKAGKQIPTAPGPEVPVQMRPGTTVVTRAPRDPLDVPTFMRNPPAISLENMGLLPPSPAAARIMTPTGAPGMPSPHDPRAAARAAYNLVEMMGGDPTAAARRAAGTYSSFDPLQALLLALTVGASARQNR